MLTTAALSIHTPNQFILIQVTLQTKTEKIWDKVFSTMTFPSRLLWLRYKRFYEMVVRERIEIVTSKRTFSFHIITVDNFQIRYFLLKITLSILFFS